MMAIVTLKRAPKRANKAQKPDPHKVIGSFVKNLERVAAKAAKAKN